MSVELDLTIAINRLCAGVASEKEQKVCGIVLKNMITRKEKEPCDDTISRQAVLGLAFDMSEIDGEHFTEPCAVVDVEDIQRLPSVNPKSKMGQWVANENPMPFEYPYSCNQCTMSFFFKTPFCPNCGAKMIEPQEGGK